ncbi:MAG: proton-translocating NADH-quinone oxidoreductase, chain [Phycisphaerales bacterium]|nr:proton-translocating NADH-quinone oxidoreductase, chain [Phycisphaerales bacterium]
MNSIWLILLLAVPLIGAVVGAFIPEASARGWALMVSLLTLVVSIILGAILAGDPAHPPTLATTPLPLIGASFSLTVDPISIWLVILTTFLMPLAIAASFGSISQRQKEYYAWMLALLVAMLGVFIARDLLLFYVFFELTLIPMFFIIGIWGGPERRYAAGKFFLFTFAGGVFTLAAAVYLGARFGTFDIPTVVARSQTELSLTARWWVLLGLLAGFAVKTPLFPVHTWLPLAHTEAPTAGSVILAGVLLKLGTYGLLRLAVPIGLVGANGPVFPALVHFIAVICIIGIIYGALVAWVQPDIKKLVAYSSVSHLGFCVLGLFALNDIGMQGSVLYMINHGLSTGAMFLVIGMIYDRYHTRDINKLSGLARNMPVLATFFIFFTLSSIGLPGLNGFVSEFLTTLGAFTSPYLDWRYGSLAAIGIILGAVYMLHMAAKVIFGPLKTPAVEDHSTGHGGHDSHGHGGMSADIGLREIGILVPIAIAVIILGVKPGLVIGPMRGPIANIRTAAVPQNVAAAPAPSTAAPATTMTEAEQASVPGHSSSGGKAPDGVALNRLAAPLAGRVSR